MKIGGNTGFNLVLSEGWGFFMSILNINNMKRGNVLLKYMKNYRQEVYLPR